jgi:hypothetical protein
VRAELVCNVRPAVVGVENRDGAIRRLAGGVHARAVAEGVLHIVSARGRRVGTRQRLSGAVAQRGHRRPGTASYVLDAQVEQRLRIPVARRIADRGECRREGVYVIRLHGAALDRQQPLPGRVEWFTSRNRLLSTAYCFPVHG